MTATDLVEVTTIVSIGCVFFILLYISGESE